MLKAVVILFVFAVLIYVARRVWLTVLALRVGAVPEGVDVPEVDLVPDRGWQVTRSVVDDVAVVRVEHPVEGVKQSWDVQLREPGAMRHLDLAMQKAGRAVAMLSEPR